MPTKIAPPTTNVKVFKARRLTDREYSTTVYRAVCTRCYWNYEPGEDVHVGLITPDAVKHSDDEGHVVEIRFDILNQLAERVHPRRDKEG